MPRLSAEQEKLRVKEMFNFDASILNSAGISDGLVLGIDEVGRGPVAGPVCAGGVVLPKNTFIEGLNDSKKITPNKREKIARIIKEVALYSYVSFVDSKVIDKVGIVGALKQAFSEVIKTCDVINIGVDVVLLDGNPLNLDKREKSVIKGDAKSAAIASASIIAKVARDEYMDKSSSEYPNYNWIKNKGYGTKEHLQAIENYGLSPLHRRSFLSKYI